MKSSLTNVVKWLKKTPQPKIIIADGKRIDVGTKGGRWGELARSIESLGASKIECQDEAGHILRACTLDDNDDAADGGAKSELQSDLHALSKIVAEAYEKGTKAPAQLLDSAMTFIERQGQRLVAQDREIERLRSINARLSAEILALKAIPGDESDEQGIMGALVQGMLQGQGAGELPASAPAPNGNKRRAP